MAGDFPPDPFVPDYEGREGWSDDAKAIARQLRRAETDAEALLGQESFRKLVNGVQALEADQARWVVAALVMRAQRLRLSADDFRAWLTGPR